MGTSCFDGKFGLRAFSAQVDCGLDERTRAVATTAKKVREKKTLKFKVRHRNRCRRCGRPRAYMRKFAMCRLCFRELALTGDVAGVTKSSW
jgi:small subunit ribosomal protein S14